MSTIQKEWAAVEGEKIILKRDTEEALLSAMRKKGMKQEDYEIVALPKAHGSIFL